MTLDVASPETGRRLRVLILADDCNPEWPSLPVVGYKYARALAARCNVVLATHVRNRENIDKRGADGMTVVYLNNEYIAAPMHKLATFLRGGNEVAWSTNMILAYLPYLAFEREVWKRFRPELETGVFDIVHRITPMSPTMPSWIAHKVRQPFVLGPLNGNLPWPEHFRAEQTREKERLRMLRHLYKYLPYARSTYRRAACILAAFQHTVDDLGYADPDRIVMFPEVGYDEGIFYPASAQRTAKLGEEGKLRILYVGRLVPYKLPEVLVRAFADSEILRGQILYFVGDGPELPRLKALVSKYGLEGSVRFEGRMTQGQVADFMRKCDVFAFPSIRELGAGVVVEAMACGMLCVVVNYGAPGALIAADRGIRVPLGSIEDITVGYRTALERCVTLPAQERKALRDAAIHYVSEKLRWIQKASYTELVYNRLIEGGSLPDFYGNGAD